MGATHPPKAKALSARFKGLYYSTSVPSLIITPTSKTLELFDF